MFRAVQTQASRESIYDLSNLPAPIIVSVGNGVVGDGVERIHHVRYDEVAAVAVACGA